MDYVLSTDNLVKSYGQARALSGLSMHVPKGAIYGIVGRNGAGKTTLIRLICGLQRPTSPALTASTAGSSPAATSGSPAAAWARWWRLRASIST